VTMPVTIDFNALARELREMPETQVDEEDISDVNSYLLNTILPMLERWEFPLLSEIDFEQFEQRDPARLVGYIEETNRREYKLTEFNSHICHLAPACVTSRAFL